MPSCDLERSQSLLWDDAVYRQGLSRKSAAYYHVDHAESFWKCWWIRYWFLTTCQSLAARLSSVDSLSLADALKALLAWLYAERFEPAPEAGQVNGFSFPKNNNFHWYCLCSSFSSLLTNTGFPNWPQNARHYYRKVCSLGAIIIVYLDTK